MHGETVKIADVVFGTPSYLGDTELDFRYRQQRYWELLMDFFLWGGVPSVRPVKFYDITMNELWIIHFAPLLVNF